MAGESNYYGLLDDGNYGWSGDTGAFKPGSITDASQGSTFYDGVGGLDLNSGGGSGNWLDSLGGYKGIQAIGGLGQLGLGFMGYLDNKKTAEMQRKLMGQQVDTNQFLLDQAKGRQADIKAQFGGSGLAAQQKPAVQKPTAQQLPAPRKVV